MNKEATVKVAKTETLQKKLVAAYSSAKQDARILNAGLHPLFDETVVLPTPPIEELLEVVRRAVCLRETGCCFTGPSGAGKTYAFDVIEDKLSREFGGIVIVKYHQHNQDFTSVRAFFKHMLASLKHPLLGKGRTETFDLRQMVFFWLVDRVRLSDFNMVVLLLDEAQSLAEGDFNFLKDIFNDLRDEGIQLVTIFMAQEPDFNKTIDMLKENARLDLIGRFCMRILPFRPFNSWEDFEYLFEAIDNAVYPSGSDITWTMYFLPKAFAAHFRLKNEARAFEAAVREAVKVKAGAPLCCPARQLFVAIRYMFAECAEFDGDDFAIPEGFWLRAVRAALLDEAAKMAGAAQSVNIKVKI